MKTLKTIVDIAGKLWNLPNTFFGIAYGGIGYLYGRYAWTRRSCSHQPCVVLAHNAIEFINIPRPFMLKHGALTLGNTIIYGSHAYSHARHEMVHTYQGQFLGPAYIPLHLLGMSASLLSYPVASLRRRSVLHGRLNFMEGNPNKACLYGQDERVLHSDSPE